MSGGRPDGRDQHIGSRIRARRLATGMSLQRLAGKVGMTWQAVQKYETGKCRVAAVKLLDISKALECGLLYFYKDIPSTIPLERIIDVNEAQVGL